MRAALIQFTGSDDPADNIARLMPMIDAAAEGGAGFVLTPEVVNCVSASRAHQRATLVREADDPMLAALREAATRRGLWLLAGSLALKADDPAEPRFANRSLLIAPDGGIAARYDKIHMFDVAISNAETYRESDGYRPGDRAVIADTPFGTVGLTICYDLRFPHLYRALAQAGAEILTVPSAFAVPTGKAHWATLLRARAIETGCHVLAPAQTGIHPASRGRRRETYGHSMAVGPWGEVLAEGGAAPGLSFVEIDRAAVAEARRRVPSLRHDRLFSGPEAP